MKVVILSARTGWHTDELCRALAASGHAGQVLPYEGLVARLGGGDASAFFEADAVLARIIPGGSLDQIVYRVNALHWLERRGVPVVNSPRAIERCVDKFLTTALLQEAGLRVPPTVVCERVSDAMAAVREFGDVVIKPLFGSMGLGIVRVGDPDLAYRVARSLEQIKAVFYVQRVVEAAGRDVRAFVVGDRVLAAIERASGDGGWRTNVARGGVARAVDLSPAWAHAAIGAARVVDADYAGVDLIAGADDEPYVLEVNGIPGWEGLQQATGVDVAAAVVACLEQRAGIAGATIARA